MATIITGGNGLNGTITAPLALTTPGQNPVIIGYGSQGAVGTVSGGYFAIDGGASQDWDITNYGTLSGTTAGVILRLGGTVNNAGLTALISGGPSSSGVVAQGGALTLDNAGTITGGGGVYLAAGGSVSNSGSIAGTSGFSSGVYLALGGDVRNNAGGHIVGHSGITSNGTLASVYNYGTIAAAYGTATSRHAIDFRGNGTIANLGTAALIDNTAGRDAVRGSALAITDITVVNEGTIVAGNTAIFLNGGGTGSATVYNDGAAALITQTGTYGNAGIVIQNLSGTVYNQGTVHGDAGFGVLLNNGGTVLNQGTITGFPSAIYLAHGGTVHNYTSLALIQGTGGRAGIELRNQAGDVSNIGTIAGGGAGIYAQYGGTVTNGGTIKSTGLPFFTSLAVGVFMPGSGAITNTALGVIVGGDGIAGGSQPLTIDNTGTIAGNDGARYGAAIRLPFGGQVDSTGTYATITGAGYGIIAQAAVTIHNTGTIAAAQGDAIKATFGETHITSDDSAARIDGATYGIRVLYGLGVIANAGQITGASEDGVRLYSGGSVTNTGTISGARNGVAIHGAGAVTNGTAFDATAVITQSATGPNHSSDAGVLIDGAGNVSNYGTIREDSYDARGIRITGGGGVANFGTLSSIVGYFGIDITGGAGTVINQGQVSGGYIGVHLSGGFLANQGAASRITGNTYGVSSNLPATLINGGTIAANAHAVRLAQGGSIINSGLLSGASADSAVVSLNGTLFLGNTGTIAVNQASYDLPGTAIRIDGSGIVTNGTRHDPSAVIFGIGAGIEFTTQPGTVVNDATITNGQFPSYGNGVALDAGGRVTNGHPGNTAAVIYSSTNGVLAPNGTSTITNEGLISGYSGDGVAIYGGLVVNHGTIAAGVTGVRVTGDAARIVNTGTISGGYAIVLSNSGDNAVVMTDTAVFGGTVLASSAATDRLVLAGNTTDGTLTGLGTDFQGFEKLRLTGDGGNLWTLTGSNTLPTDGALSLTGTLAVAGSLAAPGKLLLRGDGTLDLAPAGTVTIGTTPAIPGRVVLGADGRLSGTGTIAASVVDRGRLTASGGTLTVQGDLTGSGNLLIGSGALFSITGALTVGHITFAGPGTNETLRAGQPTHIPGTIAGFADHDVIDLVNFHADPGATTFAADTLTLHSVGGGATATLHFTPGQTLASFALSSDGAGGTNITHA